MQTLRYATGEYLDIIGEQRGISRIEAVAAMGKIELVIKPGASGLTLSAGTLFTDGERTIQLTEGIAIPANVANVTVPADIICTNAGTVGNAMMEGAELYPVQQEAKIISAAISATTSGGAEEEDDEAYRERIRTGGFYGATTGPAGAYELWVPLWLPPYRSSRLQTPRMGEQARHMGQAMKTPISTRIKPSFVRTR
jgi:uncharacterized phage protein gp47/JayE